MGVWEVAEDLGYIIGPIAGGLIAEMYKDIAVPFVFLGALILILVVPVFYFLYANKFPTVNKEAV